MVPTAKVKIYLAESRLVIGRELLLSISVNNQIVDSIDTPLYFSTFEPSSMAFGLLSNAILQFVRWEDEAAPNEQFLDNVQCPS